MKKAQIYKKNTSSFLVKLEDNTFLDIPARGNLKKGESFLYVGDFVEIDFEKKVITKLLERKNILIRPYVSNIDEIYIVISKFPEPDLLLIDKQIIIANKENIKVKIIINKMDLDGSDILFEKIKNQYENICSIIGVSTNTNFGIENLKNISKNKLIALSGQSGVGKSSIIKALSNKEVQIGDISKKNKKGRNTTRIIEIFEIDSIKIIDTCGFSSFEIENIKKRELFKYYKDFNSSSKFCYFNNCTHINETDCNVKKDLKNGKINKDRYLRYLQIYNSINDKEYK